MLNPCVSVVKLVCISGILVRRLPTPSLLPMCHYLFLRGGALHPSMYIFNWF